MSIIRPLVYYWVVYNKDGTKLLQFDKDTHKEVKFSKIENENIKKVCLYPFSKEYADGITKSKEEVIAISLGYLPTYEINFTDEDRLIYYRDCFISQEEYHICEACKKEFKFTGNPKHTIKYKDDELGIKINEYSPICPHCGAHDYFKCKSCGRIFQNFNEAHQGMCPDCGRAKGYLQQINITSRQYSRERRFNQYCFGKQNTIRGLNNKFLMRISESGDCVVT